MFNEIPCGQVLEITSSRADHDGQKTAFLDLVMLRDVSIGGLQSPSDIDGQT
jgi:hypothetical protein